MHSIQATQAMEFMTLIVTRKDFKVIYIMKFMQVVVVIRFTETTKLLVGIEFT